MQNSVLISDKIERMAETITISSQKRRGTGHLQRSGRYRGLTIEIVRLQFAERFRI